MKAIFALISFVTATNILRAQTDWHVTGNGGTSASNFIGTTDKVALKMRTNNVVRMTIDPSGNVGVGTIKPKSRLDIAGGITAYSSYFTRLDGAPGVSVGRSGANYGSVGYGLTFTDTTDTYRYNISDFSSMLSFRSGGFDFNTAPSGTAGNIISYSPVMRIQQNGNVGIGTLTPANKLSVAGVADISSVHAGTLLVKATRLGVPVADIENTDDGSAADGLWITAGSNSTNGTYFINFLRPDGTQVGQIEQTSASSIYYFSASDKRLKNIIGASQKGLLDLMKIKIYDYTFKSDVEKKVLTGLMAQELFDIFPQSVSKPRDDNESTEKNPWMVDYGSITPLIIKAVQDQQQTIDELSAGLLDLKRSNADLKKQNECFQKQIDELKAMLISQNKGNAVDKNDVAAANKQKLLAK